MDKRKLIVEFDINDDRINSIEDLEQEILTQDIYGQVARKYLDSLQNDMAQYVNARKPLWGRINVWCILTMYQISATR